MNNLGGRTLVLRLIGWFLCGAAHKFIFGNIFGKIEQCLVMAYRECLRDWGG